jgi:hypothetical protein
MVNKAHYTRDHHGRATTNLGGAFFGSDSIFSSHHIRHQSWVSLKMELEKEGAFFFFWFSRLRKRRKKRRFWVHPISKDRSRKGIFYTL